MSVSGNLSQFEQANAMFAAQDFAGAAAAYQVIVDHDPGNASAWKGLGLSFIQRKDFEKAVPCRRASILQPGSADCRYAYGYALGGVGRYDEAISELDATLALQPNHLAAKQTLIYALTQHGQKTLDANPMVGESLLERAYKLDHANAAALAPLLDWYRKTNQRGKSAKLLQSLTPDLKAHPQIAPIIEAMHADPAFHNVLHQADSAAQSAKPAAVAAPANKPSAITMVPCPQCKMPIADYAAICPHCNFQNRAVGRFAVIDSGPDVIWQDVAYNIVCFLWLGNSAYSIISTLQGSDFGRDYFLTLGIANAGIGLGLLFKVEWVMFVAKILLWLNIAAGGLAMIMGMSLGHWGSVAISFAQFALTCFFIYLINYHSD